MYADGTPDHALATTRAARLEARALRRRIQTAEANATASEQVLVERRSVLTAEESDVERLEHLSWSRIISALRGSHASEVDRERAERDAARYAVREAEVRNDTVRTELAALRSQLDALGDTEAAYAEALAAKEIWAAVHTPALADRLDAMAERRAVLMQEDREAREAYDAGVTAHNHLADAANMLDSARSWSAWDTFGGGGVFSSMVKHDRLDTVARDLRQADLALRAFGRELADLSLRGIDAVNLGPLMSTFDVWFDNIFTDLAVRSRIIEAQDRVSDTIGRVRGIVADLRRRRQAIADELDALATEREGLLTAGT